MGSWSKRIVLFLVTNIAIMVTLNLVFYVISTVFGINIGYMASQYGIDYTGMMIFCLVWGMGGAFVSLLMSKMMAKWMMKLKIIDPAKASGIEQELVSRVHSLSRAAGIKKMPEVAMYDSQDINAFATGPSKNNSLVAVSTGLLNRMNASEVEGVLGHEVAHIANGDMVTMTLVQGVVNAFVMFFARIAAFAVSNAIRGNNERSSPMLQFGLIMAFQMIFGIFGMMVVAAFSRYREFRADAGSARLGGREKMISALRALQGTVAVENADQAAIASLKISGNPSKWAKLFFDSSTFRRPHR